MPTLELPEILYQGSVKNVRGFQATSGPHQKRTDTPGSGVGSNSELVFEFSNRYSVFDWGAMPDELPEKGQALASLAWNFFQLLESGWGIKHHALGLIECAPGVLNGLRVKRLMVLRPPFVNGNYDYSAYNPKAPHEKSKPVNALVPLEIIFRFGIPEGSSLLSRTENAQYRQELGLKDIPSVGDIFEEPILEYSTKLESTDRYLTLAEAHALVGLSPLEGERLQQLAVRVAKALRDIFADMGIQLWDGKVEFGFLPGENVEREFLLADSIGPDELRLTYQGVSLSKENLRQMYRGGDWYQALTKAKKLAQERGVTDWKSICREELGQVPEALPPADLEGFSMIYQTLAWHLEELCRENKQTNQSSVKTKSSAFQKAWAWPRLKAFLERVAGQEGEGVKK